MPQVRIEPLATVDAHAYWTVYVAGRTGLPTRSVAAHIERYLALPVEEQRAYFAVRRGDAIVGTMRLLPGMITGFAMDPAHRSDATAAIIRAVDLLRAQGSGGITASIEDAYLGAFEVLGFRRAFSRMRMEASTRSYPLSALRLKPPEEGEVPKLAHFFREVYEGHMEQSFGMHVGSEDDFGRLVTAILRGETGRFMPEASFVVLDGERLTGAVLVTHWMEGPLVAELGVVPDWRRRGVGRALLSAASTRLAALGEARWALYVTVGNNAAISLYRAFGFEQTGGETVTARLEGTASGHSQG